MFDPTLVQEEIVGDLIPTEEELNRAESSNGVKIYGSPVLHPRALHFFMSLYPEGKNALYPLWHFILYGSTSQSALRPDWQFIPSTLLFQALPHPKNKPQLNKENHYIDNEDETIWSSGRQFLFAFITNLSLSL